MLFKKYEISVDFNEADEEKVKEVLWLLGIKFEGIEQSKEFPELECRKRICFKTRDSSLVKKLNVALERENMSCGFNVSW